MKYSFYIFIFAIIASSCKPLSEIGNKSFEIENITKDNLQKLNGMYSNNFDTIVGKINHYPADGMSDYQRLTLLGQLFQNSPNKSWRDENDKIINPKEKWIKIEFQSKISAAISFYHNNNFVFSKNIHGKFKNGYFYLKPKVWVLPFVPLVFGYNFERTRIGKTKDDRLLIDHKVNRWGFALVAGGEEKGVASTIFKNRSK